jgi:hypothetical protein
MVVFKSGRTVRGRASTRGLRVRVGRRRCAVGSRTALAALLRLRPRHIRLRDFGSCSRHARDAGGLYVAAIGKEAERGRGGWVYKVGRKAATAGAADPTGAFGNGLLRRRQRVTWFYCLEAGNCQSTLELRTRLDGGEVIVSVRAYDDDGKGSPVAGAKVLGGGASTVTDSGGRARLTLAPGRHVLHAEKHGLVRSFDQPVVAG